MSWVILGFLALVLSAWASGSEMAWISANPLQWEAWRTRYPRRWRIARFFLRSYPRLLITLLLANNLALVGFSAALSALLSPLTLRLPASYTFVTETLLGTLVLLVAGEYLPKVLFRQGQVALLPAVVPFTAALYGLLFPLVEIGQYLSRRFFALLGLPDSSLPQPLSRESVRALVARTDPVFQNLLAKTLALSETPVRELMVPRSEVVAVDIDTPLAEVHRLFVEKEYSRLLVYKGTTDHIVGYVHVRSLLEEPKSLEAITQPVSFVPESMSAIRLLEMLVQEKRTLAVVVDARGGMAGIVTTEDLVEEVFGEIHDEHEEPRKLERTLSPDTYELDARLEIDYLNEKYGLDLPVREVITLGGLALKHLGRIPEPGTKWEAYGFRWEVVSATPQRILTLRLSRL
ncbi:MAG: hemolysin family protein [Bacteroidia bacterium]